MTDRQLEEKIKDLKSQLGYIQYKKQDIHPRMNVLIKEEVKLTIEIGKLEVELECLKKTKKQNKKKSNKLKRFLKKTKSK